MAGLYKARWNIEIFFKTIKQHLRVKSFIGTNKKAVMSQIWCAMIAALLLRYLQTIAKFSWHMSNLVEFLRINLMSKIELMKWLDNPFARDENESSMMLDSC